MRPTLTSRLCCSPLSALALIFPGTHSRPLCLLISPSPRVARWILFHHTSNGPRALHAGGPRDHSICTGRHMWVRALAASEGVGVGGGACCVLSRCHEDLSSRLGGCHGERNAARDQPLQPSLQTEERGDEPASLRTPHLCCSLPTAQPPLLLPLCTSVQLDN